MSNSYKVRPIDSINSQIDTCPDSDVEIPPNKLSGDEAIEKSFVSNLQTSFLSGRGKANLFLTSITIVKSMVGVGILGIPNVIKNFGMLPSVFIFGFIYCCTQFSVDILIRCKNLSGHSNYSTIGFYIFKSKGIILIVNAIIILTNLGVCLSEFIVFGTTCQNLVDLNHEGNNIFWLDRRFLTVVVAILIMPLLVVKSIEKLKFVSLVAILSIASFTTILIYNFFKNISDNSLPPYDELGVFLPRDFNIFKALASFPSAILAFNWHFNMFPIYKGMARVTDQKLVVASKIGSSIATALYLIVGYLGYACYGKQTETNFLNTIQPDQIGKAIYIILNLTFTLSTTLTLPIMFFGARNNLIQFINQIIEIYKEQRQKDKIIDDDQQIELLRKAKQERMKSEKIKFYIVSLVTEFILVLTACFLTNLGLVFNVLGAVGANSVAYGFPALFYLKLKQKNNHNRIFITKKKKIFYYTVKCYFIYSCIILVVCVASEFLKEFTN